MKKELLDFLVCPECQIALNLKDEITEGEEIKEGSLSCRTCKKVFAIKESIPRFVDTDKYVDSFSFEWNKFYDVQMDILNNTDESEKTFISKTGWKPEDLKGKLILDVGIGAGRFADVVSRWGGEVVGIDLSFAVEAAFKNLGHRKNVHIIQADIFRLPLKEGSFDIVYSIGVLHHTPNTEKAFKTIISFLKKSGECSVYIYPKNSNHIMSDLWRKITTRLPVQIVYFLSWVSVPLYHVYKIPLLGALLYFIFPISMHHKSKARWLDTLDWYAPKYQWKHTYEEVVKWFRVSGFQDILTLPFPVCIRGKKS